MADDTDYPVDPDSQDSGDSWADTAEDAVAGLKQATEDAKATQRALLLAEAHRAADALPKTLPTQPTLPQGATPQLINRGGQVTQGSPTVPLPNTSPLSTPTGRMYVGPNISDAQIRALVPPGQAYINAPPASPEQAAGAAGRVAAATRPPYDPRLTAIGEDQFQAQQGYQRAVAQGMDPAAAAQVWLPRVLRAQPTGPKPMTEFQKAEVEHWNRPKPTPALKLPVPKASTMENQEHSRIIARQAAIERQMDMKPPEDVRQRLTQEWGELEDRRTALEAKYSTQRPITATGTAPPAAPKVVPLTRPSGSTPQSPFKEGQTVRNKKTGKLYKIVNGQPVPVNEGA